jgi:hypothetical protein
MQHNFFYKKIGNISTELLCGMQSDTLFRTYSSCVDFPPNVLTISNSINSTLLIKLFNELSCLFKRNGHISTNYAKMYPMSYLKEHSDLSSYEKESSIHSTMIKLQIPIITNEKIGMMWAPTPNESTLVNFDIGGIYIIDNVRMHSVVNLSNEYRYNLTSRFHIDSLLDKSLLD